MDYLYHYTSVETLALILKTRTIRFNSLANVDDYQEIQSSDLPSYGKFTYVSCWTKNEEENIPMWSMYGNRGKGVRIGIQLNPFMIIDAPVPNENKSAPTIKSFLRKPIEDNFMCGQFGEELCPLHKVIYTDDKNLIYPNIYNVSENGGISIQPLGMYKHLSWNFQNEYRYIFSMVPRTMKIFNRSEYSELSRRISPLYPHYDMDLREDAYCNMKIMMGPMTGTAEKTLVEGLLHLFNPSADVTQSNLTNLIRL